MGAYAKTAVGEKLTYRPPNLDRYVGEPFCLRITPEDVELERCFFVYLDEKFEDYAIGRLFQTYFIAPGGHHVEEMEDWLAPWLRVDSMLLKKYMLLRRMIAKVRARSGKVLFHINHGPGPINPDDSVRSHLGTSVFDDGSFDDKILDLVLEFHPDDETLPDLAEWGHLPRTSTAGATGPTRRVKRRKFLSRLVLGVIAIITLPFTIFSCRFNNNGPNGQNNQNGANGGGFMGGGL
jgi:hypothetical protein